jgi:hypothetical protein
MLFGLALDGKQNNKAREHLMLKQTVDHKSKFNQVCGCKNGGTLTVRNGKANLEEIIIGKFLLFT